MIHRFAHCLHGKMAKWAVYYGIVLCLAFTSVVLAAQPRLLGTAINIEEINTSSDEFSPVWSSVDSVLYYNSTAENYSMFYTTQRTDITRFAHGIRVQGALNKRHNNQSYIAFSNSGEIYLSSFRMTPTRPYLNIVQVFRQEGGTWSAQADVPGVNIDGFSAHPCFSPSGSTLVFSSDRPGGKGGTDLWITGKNAAGLWEQPVNMGEILNSPGNEITPFFADDDSLYFASDGLGGKGGYEVFMSVRIAGIWQPPIPLSDINTAYDESDYRIIPNNTAVFSSNRPGGKGGYDIYAIFPAPRPTAPITDVEYSIATQVLEVRIEEFSSTESFPLLPYLFFGSNSSSLSSALRTYTATTVQNYSEELIVPSTQTVYAELLNIVGSRMQKYPDAVLRLIGTADEHSQEENATLGRRRAETIQQYMNTVWGIDKNRLPVVGRGIPAIPSNSLLPEGNEENRRVELITTDTRILAPVRINTISPIALPTQVEIALDARPRTLVATWRLQLVGENNALLFADSGTTMPHSSIVPSALFLPKKNVQTVELRLSGTDSLGRTHTQSTTLPIHRVTVQQKREQRIQDKLIERYSLLLFDFNQAKLNDEHKRLLHSIAATITPRSKIVVSGYTDNIGDAAYNAQLAEQRATAVANELRQKMPSANIIIEAIGESNLFDNATPYGRFYSRTVQITIEKPQ